MEDKQSERPSPCAIADCRRPTSKAHGEAGRAHCVRGAIIWVAIGSVVAVGATLTDFPALLAILPLVVLLWALPWWRAPPGLRAATWAGAALVVVGASKSALDWEAPPGVAGPAPWWLLVVALSASIALLPLAGEGAPLFQASLRASTPMVWGLLAAAAIGQGAGWMAGACIVLAVGAGPMAGYINGCQGHRIHSTAVPIVVCGVAASLVVGGFTWFLGNVCMEGCPDDPLGIWVPLALGIGAGGLVTYPTLWAWRTGSRDRTAQ